MYIMALPSGFEPELMVPKTIVLSITPREHNLNCCFSFVNVMVIVELVF